MAGNTITQPSDLSCTPGRAARELGLKRGEFDLAVHLGRIRTAPDEGGGGRRVAHTEIDRLRSVDGFPETLLQTVRTVGTTDGAALMEVTPARFTRLARLGLVVPVKFYLNRYRAVVWLYLAEELRQFAADKNHTALLNGRTPEGMRDQLQEGLDLRPRNWRGRHLGFLLRQADGPWERAGALASLLDPVQVAEIVQDPYERAYLNHFRPDPPAHGAPGSPAAHLADRIMTAQDPDEISWLRADLAQVLDEARGHRPAPRPTAEPTAPQPAVGRAAPRPIAEPTAPRPTVEPAGSPAIAGPVGPSSSLSEHPPEREPAPEPERSRRMLGWLRRRSA
ncbi:DUF6397 family protein [Streptomyces sp. N50]|uniref:DUF6397 family protein n=1 Tax=Streptomyces sp. N50 TaxID=3081765 RepID=UPI0029621DCD|nr:DUF6397 family protein [Streptomyces sp. N50]WOX07894.1 DUF6397 family protein [Streptomyces sp. N50]